MLWPLKVRLAPMEEWVLYTTNIEYDNPETGTWVGDTISKGWKRHEDDKWPNRDKIQTWVGELISRNCKRHQNSRCFNGGRIGHLSRNYKQSIPRNNASTGMLPTEILSLLVSTRSVAKADTGPRKAVQPQTDKVNFCSQKSRSRGLLVEAPRWKVVQSFLVTVGDSLSQDN